MNVKMARMMSLVALLLSCCVVTNTQYVGIQQNYSNVASFPQPQQNPVIPLQRDRSLFVGPQIVQGGANFVQQQQQNVPATPEKSDVRQPNVQQLVRDVVVQRNDVDDLVKSTVAEVSRGEELFSFEAYQLLADVIHKNLPNTNFIISPFSVWSLMVLMAEGSDGETLNQLRKTLRLSSSMRTVRQVYKGFQQALVTNTSTVELAVNQALFSDNNRPIYAAYSNILRNDYDADHVAVDFSDAVVAADTINSYVNDKTKGKVQGIVNSGDLQNAQIVITSAIYFRGNWKHPFNPSQTSQQPFYNEKGEAVGIVNMMYQRGVFPIANFPDLKATIVELPYGTQDRLCMFIILPHNSVSLQSVIDKLPQWSIATLNAELHKYDNNDQEDDIEVDLSLPRFTIQSDLLLNTLLQHMGIRDLFSSTDANLSKISKDGAFLSRVIHKAVIEVNEVGTEAGASSGAEVAFKATPIVFTANHPFGFMIIERWTSTLLFSGQVLNPGKV